MCTGSGNWLGITVSLPVSTYTALLSYCSCRFSPAVIALPMFVLMLAYGRFSGEGWQDAPALRQAGCTRDAAHTGGIRGLNRADLFCHTLGSAPARSHALPAFTLSAPRVPSAGLGYYVSLTAIRRFLLPRHLACCAIAAALCLPRRASPRPLLFSSGIHR